MSQSTNDLLLQYDPEYQNNMLVIDDALMQTGLLSPVTPELPDIYDKYLLALIESVPLE